MRPIPPAPPVLPIASRRDFLRQAGNGFGALALAWMLHEESLRADPPVADNPLAPKPPHFEPTGELRRGYDQQQYQPAPGGRFETTAQPVAPSTAKATATAATGGRNGRAGPGVPDAARKAAARSAAVE